MFSIMIVTSAYVSMCNVTGIVFTSNVTVGSMTFPWLLGSGRPLRLPQFPCGLCLGPVHSLKL